MKPVARAVNKSKLLKQTQSKNIAYKILLKLHFKIVLCFKITKLQRKKYILSGNAEN